MCKVVQIIIIIILMAYFNHMPCGGTCMFLTTKNMIMKNDTTWYTW
jgi:hypothetical protein